MRYRGHNIPRIIGTLERSLIKVVKNSTNKERVKDARKLIPKGILRGVYFPRVRRLIGLYNLLPIERKIVYVGIQKPLGKGMYTRKEIEKRTRNTNVHL